MSISIIARNYLDQIKPMLYQKREISMVRGVQRSTNPLSDFLRSSCIFLENIVPARLTHFFSFKWINDFLHLPIIRPKVQVTRTNWNIFLASQDFFRDAFPRNLNLSLFMYRRFPTGKFQTGFLNSFFLAFPINLTFLISIRRFWLQGFPEGLRAILGYRTGETFLLVRISNGFLPLLWTNGSPVPLIFGLVVTISLLYESSHNRIVGYERGAFSNNSTVSLNINTRKDFTPGKVLGYKSLNRAGL